MPGISALQQSAFLNSTNFKSQVDGLVVQYALYLNNQHPNMNLANKNVIANIIRNPNTYGFYEAIVADTNWSTTYDVWATDPAAQNQPISGLVQAIFNLLTNYNPNLPDEMVPAPPPP